MLKKMLNEARLTFHIEATGPILIKEGETDKEKKQKEEQVMRFVVDANNRIFIPGSSIKGVWRSWCEKMMRTISEDVPLACDPFKDNSCSQWLEKEENTASIYAKSCPVCKLFGNTSLASRIRIFDAYPTKAINRDSLCMRDGIGIDRFTGGTSHGAKFRYQYLIGETFKTHVQIRNFELWQLGLLSYLFRDFEEELVPIGFGKTKGLGKVKGTIEEAELVFYGSNLPKVQNKKIKILGIGGLYKDDDKDKYCFDTETPLELESIETDSASETAIKTTIKLNKKQAEGLFKRSADYWATMKDGKNEGYYLVAQKSRKKGMEGKENA